MVKFMIHNNRELEFQLFSTDAFLQGYVLKLLCTIHNKSWQNIIILVTYLTYIMKGFYIDYVV